MGDGRYQYPILVRGDWAPQSCHKMLKNKLLRYFQSQKRSGGGECNIQDKDFCLGQVLVHFAEEEVRQQVLSKSTHELDLVELGRVKLEVQLPEAADQQKPKEPHVHKSESMSTVEPQAPGSATSAEDVISEKSDSILVTASGEIINDDVLEMYFESKRGSGGGLIKSFDRGHEEIKITFENVEDAQNVLRRTTHIVQDIPLQVRPCQGLYTVKEKSPTISSSVVLENIQDNMTHQMLTLLIENTSDLLEEDFNVEMIPELNVAVVTFRKNDDVTDFMKKCTQPNRIQKLKITVRRLECTKSIRAENLPHNVSKDYIIIYFESPKHGGGRVADAQILTEENSAIITFYDQKVIDTILAKTHSLEKKAISVYPYYGSLGTVLYGKERPVLKLPEPIPHSVNLYILRYLQTNKKLLRGINNEMADSYCELTWPQSDSPRTEVMLCPSDSLSKQRKILAKLAKTWSKQVTTKFLSIISKYKATEYAVNPVEWERMKEKVNSIVEVGILITPDVTKVALAGVLENVLRLEPQFSDILKQTRKAIEREKQSIHENFTVSLEIYKIMHNNKLEENIHSTFPGVTLTYDASAKSVTLFGLAAEVFGAKSEILCQERTLKQKTINLNPHVLNFIQQVDNEQLSYSLFTKNKINAVHKTEGNMISLIANSEEAIAEAEKLIKQEIVYQCVEIDDRTVTNTKEWNNISTSLIEAFNSEGTRVLIELRENQVFIIGYSSAVTAVYEQVSSFIDENTQIQKSIPIAYEVVVQFVKVEKKQIWIEIQKENVNVVFNTKTKEKHVCLCGPRRTVLSMAERVEQMLSLVHSKVLSIDKPGIKKWFQNMEEPWVATVKQQFNCYVMLAKDGEEYDEDEKAEAGLPCYHVKLRGGIVIGVYKDDLCKHPVDVVVNAANEDLQHIGGLALALLRASGPQLQKYTDDIVNKRGKLKPGETVITAAGNLPCKQVIHAVGPRWSATMKRQSEVLLKKAVKGSLRLAELYNHCSIAIPAISSGVFGFPLKLCVENIVQALQEHLEDSNWNSSVKQIHLVDSSQKTVEALIDALKAEFGEGVHTQPMSKPKIFTERPKRNPENQGDVQIVKTKEGLTIILKQGNIEHATTDVIVNSIAVDLKLDKGAVSKALLLKAGPKLQELLKAAAQQDNVDEGSVLTTDGCNLSCQRVLHAITPGWQPQGATAEAIEDIVKDCLKVTEKMGFKSITFPAIGTGNLGFPKPVVAASMLDQVIKSSKKKKFQKLQEVHFLLYPADTANIKAFSDELASRFGGNITFTNSTTSKMTPNVTASASSAQSSTFIGAVSAPTLGVYEIRIGSIQLQVKSGDITKENADIIVNSTNNTFNLKQGVSKAILEAATQVVENECAQKAALPHSGFITTTNGALQCKNIIHVVGQTDPTLIKKTVESVLQECEQHQHSSVAFPALGTGQGGVNASVVAEALIDAVVDFASPNNVQFVKKITFVIFQTQMLEEFYACMKKKQGTNLPEQKSFFSSLKSFFFTSKPTTEKNTSFILEDKTDPVHFQICGESQKNVDDTASWLKKLILKEQYDNNIVDEWISEFGERERERLTELMKELQIRIEVKCQQDDSSIKVSGLTRDVIQAGNEIQQMIKRISKESEQKRHAELVSNIVEWQYEDRGGFIAFDSIANLQLEQAFEEERKTITIQSGNRSYHINFETKTATYDKKRMVKIKRISKTEEGKEIPSHWETMSAKDIKVVTLDAKTKEYKDVEVMFKKTCGLKIHKIERVQNLYLWKNYVIKRMHIDEKNGNNNNEKQLFHGTAQTYLKTINTNGFNRSFAGMNAAAFGNGTYFAVNAVYSASNTYSKPDASGLKYMYLSRVLTGAFCLGRGSIVTPPPKNNQDPTDLYDSVTDNIANPSMYVIFNDVQAYPEYLITFN